MVLGDEIEQHGGLLFGAGVELHTVEGLVYLPYGALKRLVLLVTEKGALAETFLQRVDGLHGVVVGGTERSLTGGVADGEPLVVVAVEGVEGVGVVGHHVEECIGLVGRE